MTRRFIIVCALLALAGCAMDPAGRGPSLAAGGDRPVSPPAHCDRIKVVCMDLTVPGAALRVLPLPTVTLPAVPNLLTLPR
ncbi:MAG TPA: hypothetical protein VFB36_04450 [Nevskiaceae bacterium]|nr:hypothetical protein [Nevskiaceae bacterium]